MANGESERVRLGWGWANVFDVCWATGWNRARCRGSRGEWQRMRGGEPPDKKLIIENRAVTGTPYNDAIVMPRWWKNKTKERVNIVYENEYYRQSESDPKNSFWSGNQCCKFWDVVKDQSDESGFACKSVIGIRNIWVIITSCIDTELASIQWIQGTLVVEC